MKDRQEMVIGSIHGRVGEDRIIFARLFDAGAFGRIDRGMGFVELSLECRVQNRQQLLSFARCLEQGRMELCDQRADPKTGSQPHRCALLKHQRAFVTNTAEGDTNAGKCICITSLLEASH
jgi:hypothetical protein